MKPATWFELARDGAPGSKVVFTTDLDRFPECLVPAGTTGVIKENGLNDIWGGMLVLPDDEDIRKQLEYWDGAIQLGYDADLDAAADDAETDPAWTAESPIAITQAAEWRR